MQLPGQHVVPDLCRGHQVHPDKHAASLEFAKKRGLPELKHHLVPRTRGFIHTLQNVDHSKVKYLYDTTLVIDEKKGAKPTLSNILTGESVHGEVFVRRFAIKDLDISEEGASKFLMDLYQEKDRLKDHYLKTGSFPATEGYMRKESQPRPQSLALIVTLNLIVNVPIIKWALGMLLSGSLFNMTVPVVLYVFLYFVMKKMIGITKINKGSTYGSKKQN